MRLDAYAILRRAVEEGALAGWRRAHKHDSEPRDEDAAEHIARAVMDSLCEVLVFDTEATSDPTIPR